MRRYVYIVLILITASCREKYDPPIIESTTNYLVVEGFINSGEGPTTIQLSRTVKLSDNASINPESMARVNVEGDDNSEYSLTETGAGIYTSEQLNLNNNVKYRLRINTNNGKEYLSDFVAVKQTPPIDSISWEQVNGGLQIYANTHDPQNNTRYYKWDYDETWEIHSQYPTSLKYSNGTVDYDPNPQNNICWKYAHSNNIILGSSAKLESDVIFKNPLLFVLAPDEKMSVRYSMLLKQYALDSAAYQFYSTMKKNNESLGSLFDAQPSQMKGNIHCTTDAKEPVIGYVAVSSLQQKRLFISSNELSGWYFQMNCTNVIIPNNADSLKFYYPTFYLPYAPQYVGITLVGYYSSSPECVDCTLRGGVNVKPSYW